SPIEESSSTVASPLSEPDLPTGATDLEAAIVAGSVQIARPPPTREGVVQSLPPSRAADRAAASSLRRD
ncbi:hypothetical protein HAX54_042732, partial [Datura stramonium]|nr:hypothetical protein [Datura stramonium]